MTEFADALAQQSPDVLAIAKADERARAAQRRAADDRALAAHLAERLAKVERELGILSNIGTTGPPSWLTTPPKSGKKHRGTPWLLLSDLHLDEVVNQTEVLGMNRYDRRIAEQRLARTFTQTVEVTRDYWQGVVYDGIVCALGGDLLSGNIHDELAQTNEDTVLGTIDHWLDHLAAGIALFADTYGKVHVPVVVGNHGRLTRKPRAKMRARDNFDWFIGRTLQRTFKPDKRVTFDVSDSADVLVGSYGQRVLMTHGDQTRGGAGIGGIWPPIMRLDARKSARQAAVEQPYDLMVMGHWHQLVFGPKFIVNGSLKGYDEYAFTENFGFEPPQQALWLMTPERGKTFTAPVQPMDRTVEGW